MRQIPLAAPLVAALSLAFLAPLLGACSSVSAKTDAGPQAGGPCVNDGDCPGDLRCGYDVSKGCSATKGVCMALASETVPDACGCDGNYVASVAPGYASTPATTDDTACNVDAGNPADAGGGADAAGPADGASGG